MPNLNLEVDKFTRNGVGLNAAPDFKALGPNFCVFTSLVEC